MRAVVVALHGILTRTTSPSWPDHLDAYLTDCKVERRDYFAWPTPILNVFVKNPIMAVRLVAELALVIQSRLPIHFVAHSNGCDVALRAIKLLAARSIHVETLIFTGSVTDADVETSGVADLVSKQLLGRAFAYSSVVDGPLSVPFKWPYKSLGITGWTHGGAPYNAPRIRTRAFPTYGHSGYFLPENREKVFAQMRKDMGLG